MDDQNKDVNKKQVDTAAVYPQPKTYAEKQRDREAAEARRIKRRPKTIPFGTSLTLSFFIAAPGAISTDSLRLGVSVLLLGVMWAVIVAWLASRLAGFFTERAYSPVPFFAAYFVSIFAVANALYAVLHTAPPALLCAVLMVVSLLLLYFLSWVATGKLGSTRKVGVLGVTVIICIILAVVAALVQ